MPARLWTRRPAWAPQPKSGLQLSRQSKETTQLVLKPRPIRRLIQIVQVEQKSHLSNIETVPNLHVSTGSPFSEGSKNSTSSNALGYGPHDVINPDKKNQFKHAQVTSVPNMIPDTGNFTIPPGSPLLGAIKNTATSGLIILPTSSPSFWFSKAPPKSFSALPPLPSFIVTGPSSVVAQTKISGSFLQPIETPTTPNTNTQSTSSKAHALNLAVIILLAVGSALLMMGSCILIKICTKPNRQSRPKPSLPIFEDTDPEDDFFESKESPVFGGKERLSPMPGPEGPAWTWVQYPQAKFTQPSGIPANTTLERLAPDLCTGRSEFSQVPVDSNNDAPPIVSMPTYHNTKRQSIGVTSMYSPRSCSNIGQAITHDRHEPSLATDGDDLLIRSKVKTSFKRQSQLGRNDKQRNRESTASTVGLAYDCEEAGSPGVAEYTPVDKAPQKGYFEGRERIKSGYFATGTHPRISTMPSATYSIATATRVNVGQRASFCKEKFSNTASKRQRDTQALTYALGLATPGVNHIARSPQPTLYPDDSMSVADSKRQKECNHLESDSDIPVIVPERVMTRNGLMSMDFRVSQMSLSELTIGLPQDETKLSNTIFDYRNQYKAEPQSSATSQNVDIPPRVPSPPPLPSLAQMALSQHNPEAYATYRSPTYSLYGLYENSDRNTVIR